ncbi:CHAP domain-containing protein, partial [Enterococcus hirae]
GAGTKYGLTHVIGNTSAASDIGIAYDWSSVGWKVIQNPRYDQLVVGAIINFARGAQVASWFADLTYGHTGVIRGLENGRIQTYEQNTELGMICGKLDRQFYSSNNISSIVIPPK